MVSERKVEQALFLPSVSPKQANNSPSGWGCKSVTQPLLSIQKAVKNSDAVSGYTVLGGLKGLGFIAGRGTSSAEVEPPRMSKVGSGEAVRTGGTIWAGAA